MTPEDLARFRGMLQLQRTGTLAAIAELGSSLVELRAARSDGTADDEHDPDGSTLSGEWSRVSGLDADFTAALAAIDRALGRIDTAGYGRCRSCGGPIGAARLEARPAAELCIECARAAEDRR
ncbi:RNA polymerase-binding transcription factor DksA [Marisediminicola sp. UYEF4]|uniref:TraR/DksA family transcriptional regulator n=1 Tax=Marisediminicola sp. UYEF4 TaxID=1756384 RepID=UPI003398D779